MVFAVVFGIVFAALVIGGFAFSIVSYARASKKVGGEGRKLKKIGTGSLIAAIAFFALFLCIPFSFHTVQAGEVAVVKHMGEANRVRTAGTYFDFWMTETYESYDAKVQNLPITTQAYSRDAQTMDIEMTVQYQIDTSKVIDIANTYGSLEILNNRIESVAVDAMKTVMSENTADQIIQDRAAVSMNVTETIMAKIDSSYYVSVKTAVLTDIGFTDAYEAAVEAQMIAEREKEAAITKAEQELEVAKKEAQAMLETAQGEANAQKALAEAEAYSASVKIVELARTLGYSVTEATDDSGMTVYSIDWGDGTGQEVILSYLQYLEYLAKWNGELPNIVTGDGGVMITVPASE